MLWAFFLSSSFSGSAPPLGGLSREKGTWQEFTVFAPDAPDRVLVPGFVEILGPWLFSAWVGDVLRVGEHLKRVLGDYLLDSPLHHALILLGVDVLGLSLVLHVLHLLNIRLVLLVALDAVVDAGGRPGRLIEERLELEGLVVDGMIFGQGEFLGILVEVLPAVVGILP